MRKIIIFSFLILSVISFCTKGFDEKEIKRKDDAYLIDLNGIFLMHCKGTPYEIGVQQAYLSQYLGEISGDEPTRLDPFMQEHKGIEKLEWFFNEFYYNFKMGPEIIRNISQEYLEEIQGFADTIAPDDEQMYQSLIRSNAFQELTLTGCTSFAFWDKATRSKTLLHARNLDIMDLGELADFAFISIIEPQNGFPFITVQYPTQVGLLHGMNSQGLVVTVNFSIARDKNTTLDGICWPFLVREIIQYDSTLDEAIERIKRAPKTIGLNIMISDSKENKAVVLEVTANEYIVRESDNNYIYAANRYLTEYMRNFQSGTYSQSKEREERLEELYYKNTEKIDSKVVASFLRDKYKPGSANYNNFEWAIDIPGSVISIIFDPENLMLWCSKISEKVPAPDNPMRAVSLKKAIEGENPVLHVLDIYPSTSNEHQEKWLIWAKARINEANGLYNEGQKKLDNVLESFPEAAAPLKSSAITDVKMGNFQSAREKLIKITEQDDILPQTLRESMVYLGVLNDVEGNREKALGYYRKSLEIDILELEGLYENEPVDSFYKWAKLGLETPLNLSKDNEIYKIAGKIPFLKSAFSLEKYDLAKISVYKNLEGKTINRIVYSGLHTTKPSVLGNVLNMESGELLSLDTFRTASLKLSELGSLQSHNFAAMPVDSGNVDITVRLREGFGFYLDPVQQLITMATEILFEQKLSVTYYNAFGMLGVIKAGFSWSDSQEKSISLSFPVKDIPFKASYVNYIKATDIGWGKYSGSSYSLMKNELYSGCSIYGSPRDIIKIAITYENVQVETLQSTSGLVIDDNDYLHLNVEYKRMISPPYVGLPYKYKCSLFPSVMLDFSNVYFHFNGYFSKILVPFNGITIKPYFSLGIMSPETPFDYWYTLGNYPDFASAWGTITVQKYIFAGAEMRLQFTSGFFISTLADTGKFWEDSSNWDFSKPAMDLGIGIGYQISGSNAVKVYYLYDPLNRLSNFTFGMFSNY
ncbi:MAG: C45 family autoproteolytic acyltransferase/hydrolase [Kosmotogaceae bacterium]